MSCVRQNSPYVKYLNIKFGLNLPEERGIDIYDTTKTPRQIIEELEKPLALCAYCPSKFTLVDDYAWKQVSKNTCKADVMWNISAISDKLSSQ